MSKDTRSTQTKTKHTILNQYLDSWAGIIYWGLKSRVKKFSPKFIYVDCFSYKGVYSGGDLDEPGSQPVYGSPVIGIQAMDKFSKYADQNGMPVITNIILVEADTKTYQTLLKTLKDCGYGERIRETVDFDTLLSGQIAVVNADAKMLVDQLVGYTDQPDTWAFYLLDPYGASGIPFEFVEAVVRGKNHDVMINFIYEDFLRKTGFVFKETLSKKHQHLLDLWKGVFGPGVWEEKILTILEQIDVQRQLSEAVGMSISIEDTNGTLLTEDELLVLKEEVFVSGYTQTLQDMDEDLVIKLIALKYPSRERTMLYLFLTTHDPTGALILNKVLFEAQLLEHELRHKARMAMQIRAGQMALFDPSVGIEAKVLEVSRPSTKEIAKMLQNRFAGCTITRKDIYQSMVDTDLFPEEINKALRYLHKMNRASIKGKLTHRSLITFENN